MGKDKRGRLYPKRAKQQNNVHLEVGATVSRPVTSLGNAVTENLPRHMQIWQERIMSSSRREAEPAKSSGFPLLEKVINSRHKKQRNSQPLRLLGTAHVSVFQLKIISADSLFAGQSNSPYSQLRKRAERKSGNKHDTVKLCFRNSHATWPMFWEGRKRERVGISPAGSRWLENTHQGLCASCSWIWLHLIGQIQTGFRRTRLTQDKRRRFWLKSVWTESQLFGNQRNFDGNKGCWILHRESASIASLTEGKGWVSHSPELQSVIDRTAKWAT